MKKLKLNKQVIASLQKDSMNNVVGGQNTVICLTGVYPTLDRPCATVNDCVNVEVSRVCPPHSLPCLTGMYPTLDGCATRVC